ncbi:hypothetical protein [Streptomyces sp. NPDC058989]|uniref:hypothetical protein n=1 Tax=Streptomyces sp. NPDC058989 TaxID=3346686 RepID=UPI0036C56223
MGRSTDLAHAPITESGIGDAVRAYENLMLPRSAQAAQDCVEALDCSMSVFSVAVDRVTGPG